MTIRKILVLALLLPFSGAAVRALPFWTEKSCYIEGDYLYAVGIASELDKEEAARTAAFTNGVAEIRNFLLADDVAGLSYVETQMTYTDRLTNGKFTVYRLVKVPISAVRKYLDHKSEATLLPVSTPTAAVAASTETAAAAVSTCGVSIMLDEEYPDELEDEYLAKQLEDAYSVSATSDTALAAIESINKVLADNPDYSDAYYTRAALYVSVNNYPAAIADVNQALKYRRDNRFASSFKSEAAFFSLRAKAEQGTGNYGSAVADLKRAAQLRPNSKAQIFYLPVKGKSARLWKRSDFEDLNRRFPQGERAAVLKSLREAKKERAAYTAKLRAEQRAKRHVEPRNYWNGRPREKSQAAQQMQMRRSENQNNLEMRRAERRNNQKTYNFGNVKPRRSESRGQKHNGQQGELPRPR